MHGTKTTTASAPPTVALIDHTTDLVAVVRDGLVVASSPGLRELLRRPAADLHGTRWQELVHHGDHEVAASAGRVRLLDVDGIQHDCEVHARVRDDDGTVLVVLREVSSQLEVDRLAALLRRLTELANSASDLDDVLVAAVRDVRATLGWSHGRVVSFAPDGSVRASGPWDPAVPQHDAGDEGAIERARLTAAPVVDLVRRDDGDDQLVVVPVAAGVTVAAVLQFWTGEPRAVESPITSVLSNVGGQLGLVAARQADRRSIEAHEDELQRSNAELERFAYVASHDLQEPLRKVATACELLERRFADLLDDRPDARTYVEIAVDASRRMQTLIRDLLTYSRVGRGASEPEEVDLARVVDDVVAGMATTIDELDARIVVGPLPTVWASAPELHQVMGNLLGNALKYRGDEPPHVEVAATVPDGGLVEVTVTDNGIGIEPEYATQVFEVFRRLHRPDQYEGTGIGLSIVKRIVEHHGGRVWITTPPTGGTRMHLTLTQGTAL